MKVTFIKYMIVSCMMAFCAGSATSQIGLGMTYGLDLYQYQANPLNQPFQGNRGIGSAIFNLNIGPKLFIGTKNYSIAAEAQLGIAPFAFDINQYKGLGAFYFPMMVSLNFKGLSGFYEKSGWGVGIAGGYEFARTDLYFIKDEFENLTREMFQTTFLQFNVGLGSKAKSIYAYFRYGGGELGARNWHVGIMFDRNLTQMKKIKKRETIIDGNPAE